MNISVDRLYCTGCGECVAICPENIITLKNRRPLIAPEVEDQCTDCGLCRDVCPAVVEKSKGRRFVHLEYCQNCIGNCLYNRVKCLKK